LEAEYADICEAASLFEVHVPEPKSLRQCTKELRLAKNIWDYTYIVASLIEDWKTTPWQGINVENMDLECKRMAKEVKAMDKDVKGWEIFAGLEGTIRNMISSLKSVSELQNPSIRERHWEELMQATKVKSKDIIMIPTLFKKYILQITSYVLVEMKILFCHKFMQTLIRYGLGCTKC
jgi:dynein heavy chain